MLSELAKLLDAIMWPAFALIALWTFRVEIKRFFSDLGKRDIKVDTKGVTLISVQGQGGSASVLEKGESGVDKSIALHEEHDSQVYKERISAIESDPLLKAQKSPEEREKLLIRAVATWQILAAFENVLSTIWPSQIEALRMLSGHNGQAVDVSVILPFYDRAKEQYPDVYANYVFDAWLGFIVAHNLAVRNGSQVCISSGGQEFLKFMDATGRRPRTAVF